jgi:hypothetical protein
MPMGKVELAIVIKTEFCQKSYIVIEKVKLKLKLSWLQKIETLSTHNDSFGKNWGAKNLGKLLLRILQNMYYREKFHKIGVLPLVKINTRISHTLCIIL